MKATVIQAPADETKPAIRLEAQSDEDQTVLWILSRLGPEMYQIVENEDSGDARASSLILADVDAES